MSDRQCSKTAIKTQLRNTGVVLCRRKLPPQTRRLLDKVSSNPDVVRDWYDYTISRIQSVKLTVPTTREVTELDECLRWLLWLSDDERRVVFAQMLGIGFRRLAYLDRKERSKSTLARVFDEAVEKILQWVAPIDTAS